jgi:hypothetical protein
MLFMYGLARSMLFMCGIARSMLSMSGLTHPCSAAALPAGMSPGDYLQQRTATQQEPQLEPVPPLHQQQQQQGPVGGGLMPAVQPKLAPQYCVDGAEAVADPLASLLLDDDADGGTAAAAPNGTLSSSLAAGSSRQDS